MEHYESQNRGTVLLIEDNAQILRGNERMLRRQGYDVMCASSLSEARERLGQAKPDIIVLDIMLPDGSGLVFLSDLRAGKIRSEVRRHMFDDIPVLILTGLSANDDIIRGLSAGGDDYIVKPYDFNILIARIEALLRRTRRFSETLTKGNLRLNIMANQAFLNGNDLMLSHKEFLLLAILVKNERRPLPPEYIYETVWNNSLSNDRTALQTTVSRLRKKLGDGFVIDYDSDGYVFSTVTG